MHRSITISNTKAKHSITQYNTGIIRYSKGVIDKEVKYIKCDTVGEWGCLLVGAIKYTLRNEIDTLRIYGRAEIIGKFRSMILFPPYKTHIFPYYKHFCKEISTQPTSYIHSKRIVVYIPFK